MPTKGLYLTIGVRRCDPTAYEVMDELGGAENDAHTMAKIARSQRFTGTTLLTREATSAAVLAELQLAAQTLEPGDIFLVSFSGHGGQVPDTNGDDEPDALDETWCLYDRQLIDDELYAVWATFKAGVRIVVFSDSCHSGTIAKRLFQTIRERTFDLRSDKDMTLVFKLASDSEVLGSGPGKTVKGLPLRHSLANYRRSKNDYDTLQTAAGPSEATASQIGASVIIFSGCQDSQRSWDNGSSGDFTKALTKAWANGAFSGTHGDFHEAIATGDLEPDQVPNYSFLGTPNPAFEGQRPFTV